LLSFTTLRTLWWQLARQGSLLEVISAWRGQRSRVLNAYGLSFHIAVHHLLCHPDVIV
jgi:hypothetical protein